MLLDSARQLTTPYMSSPGKFNRHIDFWDSIENQVGHFLPACPRCSTGLQGNLPQPEQQTMHARC